MSETARLLHEEHLRTLEAMNTLEDRVMGDAKKRILDRTSDTDRAMVERLIAVIDQDVYRHFRFEEDVLFPALEKQGVADMSQMLVQEHAAIRPLADRVRSIAARSLEGDLDAASWEDFREGAMDLIHSVLFHIQKEEMSLLKKIAMLIDADTDGRLAQTYRSFQ